MPSKIFLLTLIIFPYIQSILCVDYQYDRPNLKPNNPANQEVSVHFPKYNIKIAPTIVKRPSLVYQEVEIPQSEEYHYIEEETTPDYHEPEVYYVESEPIHVIDYNNEHMPPIVYHNEPQSNQHAYDYNNAYNQQLYILSQPVNQPHNQPEYHAQFNQHIAPVPPVQYQHQPIITRQPVELPHKINPEYLRHVEDFNEEVGLARKHKNDWFYSTPNWNQNNENILRAADPRAIVASHTSFVKVKKPFLGSHVAFTSHKKFLNTNHGFGGTNIHKNTHIHVHNRDAAGNDDTGKEIIGSHLFGAPRWSRDISEAHTRTKRGFLDVPRLLVDPKAKLDLHKTSENVGAATRNVFEEDYSPVFHLTNALGSAQDSFHSLINVRPSGILIPCR